ncbi:DeoR/GlpR family DNA-binding transcription regulator [Sporomusa acidovorans]|uniref:Glucitol operon repressor n=1 Tax=Sporomusa acidovorans (strain ATCC 49682 / DSM 3132 / Mol) TaxID=1123286 RepID=A0ABZ3J080_SPOA4|nr:DeoR/GlpR family DNA-binding transcription regulator [Sporomusa acidovorans]OZC22785.1 glucitol operon repressor [Sporomusa acidovorans DSM 3132]SDE50964.1 transcriptional regulator, DeoR family [Sporomusa acidovorans]
MLYEEERKLKIVEYLQDHLRASVQELSKVFQVSESTIRRDLQELEDAKLLKRTHGGAVCLENVNVEPTFVEKEDKFRKEKARIAQKAAEFIQDGDTLVIDSGTTTAYLAKELRKFSNIKVVTNSIILAQELRGFEGIEVIMTGGTLRQNTLAMVGPITEHSLSMLRVDKAFMATNGLDLQEGLTTPNLVEAATKARMIDIAKQVILLTDHTKIGKVAFARFAGIARIDTCIVDDKIPQDAVNEMEKLGVRVCVVTP